MKQQEKALAALDPEAAMRLLMTLPSTLAHDPVVRTPFGTSSMLTWPRLSPGRRKCPC